MRQPLSSALWRGQPAGHQALTGRGCAGPVTRREFLRLGALGLGGLTMADTLRLQAQAHGTANADTSVIFLWLPGGPPHMEMYDLKPEAPSDYRGELRPIATNVPGLEVSELLPRHATIADRFNIVRSISHTFADHGGGHKRFMTGREPLTPVDTVNDAPATGSIVAKMREHVSLGLPNYVLGADPGREGVDVFALGAAYLGPAYTPFAIAGDPAQADFRVPNIAPVAQVEGRLDNRAALLQRFDRFRQQTEANPSFGALDKFHQQAISLITSDRARVAFDLSREPAELRDRYGRHAWGQRALLARRLVEAGCSFVTMILENPYQSGVPWLKSGVYNWDSHSVNCHLYDDLRVRLPIYDQAVTALIEDLYDRGLDKRVLLIVTGEFGRTPRLENQVGTQTGVRQPGRDHWPQAMSLLITGGGMRTGQVIGSTTAKGEVPKDRPLTPNDLWATVYRHLGIDTEHAFPDYTGRPMPILASGAPIRELLPVT